MDKPWKHWAMWEDNHKSVGLRLYEISRTCKTRESEKVDWAKGKGESEY